MERNEIIKNEKLEKLTLRHLGTKDTEGLSEWYSDCIDSDVRYVVFVVRRSYVLSLVLEALTGWRMTDSEEKKFVTDSAFLSCCEELASYYREHYSFPKIRLCDDMLIHGRNLNRVIQNVEERLNTLLPEVDKERIVDALSDAVQIRVYCMAMNKHLMLRTEYLKDAKYAVKYEPEDWHELSSHISSLIIESGIANAVYINSEVISAIECGRVVQRDSEYRMQIFQNVEGYVKTCFLRGESGEVYAVYTLRLLKNKLNDKYRVIPFVFMPNLDDSETLFLLESVKKIGLRKGYPEVFFERLRSLYELKGKRVFNEWMSLLISQAVLKEFNDKFDIQPDHDTSYQEIEKLSRNYRFDFSNDHIEYLKLCLTESPILTTTKELDSILLQSNSNRPIMTLGDQAVSQQRMLGEMKQAIGGLIQNKVENYFYEIGCEEEREAIQYNSYLYVQHGVSSRTVKGCCFVFKDLFDRISLESAKYGVSCFLLMMDAGVLSLSSHPPKDVNVVGFAQFAKAGEQSLLIEPLRYMEYIPFLSLASQWCWQFNRDFIEHLKAYKDTEFCDIPEKIEGLIDFIKELETIGEEVSDWNGYYYEKIDFKSQAGSIEDMFELDADALKRYLQRQYSFEQDKNRHVDNYKKYMLKLTKGI